MAKTNSPVRLVFTDREVKELLGLIRWAKAQGTYHAFAEKHLDTPIGAGIRMAAMKLAVASGDPDALAEHKKTA